MKISFIGTSHGVPASDRSCSSSLIRVGERSYYVDAGAAIAERTLSLGYKLEESVAVFTTHAHSDHTGGLVQFVDLFNWYLRNSSLTVYLTEERIMKALEELVSACSDSLKTDRIALKVADSSTVYDDGFMRVSYFPTKHMAVRCLPSYGMLLEAEGKRIYFSGDMSQGLAENDFPSIVLDEEVDLFVCELAHFTLDHMAEFLPRIKAKRVAFTHVYPLAKYESIEALKGKYPYEILTPSDMDTLEI